MSHEWVELTDSERAVVRESGLPALAECLRGTLAQESATIAALRSECHTLGAELATLHGACESACEEITELRAENRRLRAELATLRALVEVAP